MDMGAWQATVHGVARVRHNLVNKQKHKVQSSMFLLLLMMLILIIMMMVKKFKRKESLVDIIHRSNMLFKV